MNRISITTLLLMAGLVSAASAGTVEGTVSPGNSVVYLEAAPGRVFSSPVQKPLIKQERMMFSPALLVVQQGTTVEFENDDDMQHNVSWPSVGGNKKLAHNLGTWSKGERRSFKFDHPGVVPLLCSGHSEMASYIVVSPTPYFAVTDDKGNYRIDNLPDGKYNLVAWHEGMKQRTESLSVSGTHEVDFVLLK